jgi:hypothetical protein
MKTYVIASMAAILGFGFGVLFPPTSVKAQSVTGVYASACMIPCPKPDNGSNGGRAQVSLRLQKPIDMSRRGD